MSIAEYYTRLKVALDTGELPYDVAEWLRLAVRDYELSGGKKSLCTSLGLRGPGIDHISIILARKERDQYLRKAWKSVSFSNITDWERSSRLLESIKNFNNSTWLRFSDDDEPPKRLDDFQVLLFKAFKCGVRMPTSVRQVDRIAKHKQIDINPPRVDVHKLW